MADFPDMTPKAEAAFASYVGLGPSRTIAAVARAYVSHGYYKTTGTAEKIIGRWSIGYQWQARLAAAISERTRAILDEASELDSETFLNISREYNRRGKFIEGTPLPDLHPMRDRVKPIMPTTNININVNLQEKAAALATQLGVSVDDVLREAELVAAEAWDRWEA